MPSISIAEELAKKQREISISEFFERNKQILGYDSATKALLTAVEEDFVVWERAHGTRVEIPLKGRYNAGKQSIPEYLKATAIVNPHARITYRPPEGEEIVFERATEDLPPKTKEIPPHPHGIELGTLMAMMKETKSYKLAAFLEEEFVRVSSRVAKEICDAAGLDPDKKPKSLVLEEAKALHDEIG